MKKILATTALLAMLAQPALAQQPAQTQQSAQAPAGQITVEEAVSSNWKEKSLLRATGSYEKGSKSLDGFVDIFGNQEGGVAYFGKIFYRDMLLQRDQKGFLGDSGLQAELNYTNTDRYKFRAGIKQDFHRGNFKGNVRLMPFCIDTTGAPMQIALETYQEYAMGRIYLENWSQHNLNFTSKITHTDEATVGKMINDKIGAQVQIAYNVDSPGWVLRVGVRYKAR